MGPQCAAMRLRILPCLAALTLLAFPAAAHAAFEHVVAPGESLSSVAAADGLSVAQLAAANGVSADTQLIAGTLLAIPAQTSSPATQASSPATQASSPATQASSPATQASSPVSQTSSPVTQSALSPGDGDGDADDASSAVGQTPTSAAGSTATSSSSASSGGGSYVVQPGDTLSAIAARAGISPDSLAAANGMSVSGTLLAGSVLKLSGAPVSGAPSTVTMVSQPVSTSTATSGGPYPTPQTVSASDIGSIAASNGVSPSLAAAVGWQESGFNNDLVSGTGAVGVMQIEPGTWNWIGQNLAGSTPLSPYSASDNVRGGVLLLHSLLSATGGDPALAAAGYYQGLASVQQHGLYSDTQQYVNDVLALRSQFGGP
jgi:soluble lytic murein transglycosylase-like protein